MTDRNTPVASKKGVNTGFRDKKVLEYVGRYVITLPNLFGSFLGQAPESVILDSEYLRRRYGLYHIQNHSRSIDGLYQKVF